MVEILQRQVLLAKIESTYGTDPTPTTAANAIEARDIEIREIGSPVERPILQEKLSRKPSLLGDRFVEFNFKVAVKGSGTAGTAPRIGACLRACGMDETIVSNTSVTYEPVSSSHDSVTFYLYKGGRRHIIKGARGNVKGICEAGQEMMLEFSFMGIYADPTVVAIPTDAVYDTTTAICKNGTFNYNSKSTLVVSMLDFDLANVVSKRPSLSDSNAVAGFEIVSRKPIASINPETQVETSYDFRGDALSTQRQVDYAIGSIATVTLPKFNPFYPEFEDADGVLRDKLNGEAAEDNGDDEVALAFIG